jgi:hypothetical protein
MSADGLVLFRTTFVRPPSKTTDDETLAEVVMCTRKSKDEPFRTLQSFDKPFRRYPPVGAVVSLDGRRLYFMSRRPGGHGLIDLYVSRRVPKSDDR